MKNKLSSIILIFFITLFIFTPSVLADNTNTLELTSQAAILIDSNTGKILYEKNIDEKLYPASITKILTAIVVLENCKIDEVAVVNKTAIDSVSFGYVTANLKEGEELKVEDLLHLLMVSSANDAAFVLAEHVSGTTDEFYTLMNKTAKGIGCKNSKFVNPNGIHDENQYSTAYDLALIANYAMKNTSFRNLVSKTYISLPATNMYSGEDRIYSTTNELILSGSKNYYKYAFGIKTGFTTPAGYCLVSSADKNGLELIAVVLKSTTSDARYDDIKKLFNYGYDNYTLKEIAEERKCNANNYCKRCK